MRLVYLSSSIIPSRTANSIHVMKMCQAFAKNGHEVVLLTPDHKGVEPGVDDIFAYYGVEEHFSLIKLPWLAIKAWVRVCGYLAAWEAKRFKPDIVYGRNLTACFFAAGMGLSTIFESHQPISDSDIISQWFFKWMVRRNGLTRLVVITRALGEYYSKNYPKLDGKILVAADAADAINNPIRAKSQIVGVDDPIKVGYVGNLYKGKAMEIIAGLAKKCSWVRFHVVGGTEADLAYWKNYLASQDNIIFHGFLPHAKVAQILHSFDVLLAPFQSRVSPHGRNNKDINIGSWFSPLKIFEYMASGKAIVCSDLPVLREVLTDEHNALLCRPDDINSWEHALIRLFDDAVLRRSLGKTAYQDFLQNHTWKARAKKVLTGISYARNIIT